MLTQIKQYTSDITLNMVNAVYLVKDWILLNVGVSIGVGTFFDDLLKWGIGLTIIIFNIVRIVKTVKDIKSKEDE